MLNSKYPSPDLTICKGNNMTQPIDWQKHIVEKQTHPDFKFHSTTQMKQDIADTQKPTNERQARPTQAEEDNVWEEVGGQEEFAMEHLKYLNEEERDLFHRARQENPEADVVDVIVGVKQYIAKRMQGDLEKHQTVEIPNYSDNERKNVGKLLEYDLRKNKWEDMR